MSKLLRKLFKLRRAISYVTSVALILSISIVAITWVYMAIQPYAQAETARIEISRAITWIETIGEKSKSIITQGINASAAVDIYLTSGHLKLIPRADNYSIYVNNGTRNIALVNNAYISHITIATKTPMRMLSGYRILKGGNYHFLNATMSGDREWYHVIEKQTAPDYHYVFLRFKILVQNITYTDPSGQSITHITILIVNFTSPFTHVGMTGQFRLTIRYSTMELLQAYEERTPAGQQKTYKILIYGHDNITESDFSETAAQLTINGGTNGALIRIYVYLISLEIGVVD